LPEPTNNNIKVDKNILEGNPVLSSCVEDSITALSRKSDSQNKISATDMFVDIAKYGTGKSVTRLRTNGVTPEKVDEIINQLGWQLIER
ncbi:MAG TPA: hypothetical protein DIW23_12635, partial [Anaerolineae bacterium]|nr:hypothetical protein [Anaerolineae bacterium]